MVAAIVLVAVVVILLFYYVGVYNRLIRLRNQGEEAASAIDAHLKQRYDLVPNLVETVKGYAKHEQGTLTAVIAARNKAMSASTLEEKDEANKGFSATLKSLFALSEAYPDLKANAGFLDLQKQLQRIEEQLLSARKYYNAVIKQYNTITEVFPSSIVASVSHFSKKQYLAVEEEAKARVQVKF
jgi:LemA protein